MISRRFLLVLGLAALAATAAIAGSLPSPRLNVLAQGLLEGPPVPPRPQMPIFVASDGKDGRLAGARLHRISITTIYGPAYVTLVHPGDVPPERDVCSGI
ncbi:MAG: hypothetical protein E6G89_02505 [Alphaproteobacteria bacterium]|nr:MAG: hypothetical protein E6G89_02505 [Alphaproteobacteria bacterium]